MLLNNAIKEVWSLPSFLSTFLSPIFYALSPLFSILLFAFANFFMHAVVRPFSATDLAASKWREYVRNREAIEDFIPQDCFEPFSTLPTTKLDKRDSSLVGMSMRTECKLKAARNAENDAFKQHKHKLH